MKSRNRAAVGAFVIGALMVANAPIALAQGAGVPSQTKPPKEWDERVQPFVDFIEGKRGLDFKHPVPVTFQNDKAFNKGLIGDSEPTQQEREDARHIEGQFRAFGLVESDFDLLDADEDFAEDAVVGYYDSAAEEMFIRGTSIDDVDTRVTVVHELTHALQDQYFDLDKMQAKAKTSGESFAVLALIEGDASDIETEYLSTLPQAEQDEYYGEIPEGEVPPELELPETIPTALALFYDAPYTLGLSFIYVLDAEGGTDARDAAFRKGVRSDEQIIDPVAWAQRQGPAKVAAPDLGKGEKASGDVDDFGALSLFLVLASRIDPAVALTAVTGWGGDRSVPFVRKGKECVRAAFTGDTDVDTEEIAAALESWVATRPADAAGEVARDGEVVEFTVCEADGTTAPDDAQLLDAFYGVLDYRIYTTVGFQTDGGYTVVAARCVADGFASRPAIREFENQYFDTALEDIPADVLDRYVTAGTEVFDSCGVAPPG